MHYKKILPLLLVLGLSACELTLVVDLPEQEPKLVINSLFYPDEAFSIEVTASKGILDTTFMYDPLPGAEVKLIEDGLFVEQLTYNNTSKQYESILMPQEGKTYKLEVNHDGYTSVTAEDKLPLSTSISGINITRNVREVEGEWESDLDFVIEDPVDENFYSIEIFVLDTINMHAGLVCFKTTDPAIKSGATILDNEEVFCNRVYFEDKVFNGTNHAITITIKEFDIDWGHRMIIVLRTLSRANYMYNRSVKIQQYTRDNPFAEPVIVFNNIVEGLGIFAGGVIQDFELGL